MMCLHSDVCSKAVRRIGITVAQAVVLALVLAMALPAMASSRRPVKTLVKPVYPVTAKHMRISGPVNIDVTVDPNGNVTDVKTLYGPALLARPAEDAIRLWRFAPSSDKTNENVIVNFTYNN